jgi:hypothetical protein
MPCPEKRARLERGRAVVVKRHPFAIRLSDRIGGETQPVRIKPDPGSKTTGIAVVTEAGGNKRSKGLCLFELRHRGNQINEELTARRGAVWRPEGDRIAGRTGIGRADQVQSLPRWGSQDARARRGLCWNSRGPCWLASSSAHDQGNGPGFLLSDEIGQIGFSAQLLRPARGFQTGDIVRADISKGKKTGTYLGRVAVRASGFFNVQTPTGVVQGIHVRHCALVHRSDGYSYRKPHLLPTDKCGVIRRGKI